MPRENRKRGKKHKRQPEQEPKQQVLFKHEEEPEPTESLDKPIWIVPGPKQEGEANPEVPYGFVDVDVKAYFRTVDVQIRDWQENRDEDAEEVGDTDPNERMLLSLDYIQLLFDSIIYYRKTFILHGCIG